MIGQSIAFVLNPRSLMRVCVNIAADSLCGGVGTVITHSELPVHWARWDIFITRKAPPWMAGHRHYGPLEGKPAFALKFNFFNELFSAHHTVATAGPAC